MEALEIAQLSLGLAASLADAFQRYQTAQSALAAMLEEGRGPTNEEVEALRAAGAAVDARLDELLG